MTFAEAKRKARYGHRSYVGRGDAFEILSRASLKRALLAAGTQGHFTVIDASTAVCNRINWQIGTLMYRNIRFLLAA